MAIPSSGELKLWDTLWNQELGGTKGENSLHSASVYAGFSTPDALSDFYGWSDVEVPSVTTNSASSLASTSFTANGTVNSTGNENPDRGFYMGTNSSAAGNNTKYSIGTGGAGAFSRSFTGLSSQTNYYYWAYACNSAGEAIGGRVTATTTAPPFSPSTAPQFDGINVQNWQSNSNNSLATYATNPYTGGGNTIGTYTAANNARTVQVWSTTTAADYAVQVNAWRCSYGRRCFYQAGHGGNVGGGQICGPYQYQYQHRVGACKYYPNGEARGGSFALYFCRGAS